MNNFVKYSDEKLIDLMKAQKPESDYAFDTIFNRYSSKLNAFCVFRTNNKFDAEDVFEDTWLRFINKIREGKVIDNILAYLYTIARNIITDRYREKAAKKNIKIEYIDFSLLDEQMNPLDIDEQFDNQELMALINIALTNLDEIYRETFVMYWFGGLTYKEIAEVQLIGIGAVKMRCYRAMKELIQMLKPYFADLSK